MPRKTRLNNVILYNRPGIYFRDESDTSPDIFRVTQFPTRLTAGKNVLKIQGNSNTLREGSFIEIEVLDSNNDAIYTEMLDYLEDDGSRAIAIYIYPDTAEGDGRITLGTEITQINGQTVPQDKQGKVNTIWSKLVPITPTVNNESEIIFTGEPTINITEQIGVQLDRSFPTTGKSGADPQNQSYTIGKVKYIERNNKPIILAEDSSIRFHNDMLGGTLSVTNPVNPIPDSGVTLNSTPSYTSKIKKVLNDTSLLMESTFTYTSSALPLQPQKYTDFDASNYLIDFTVSPIFTVTQNSQSFAITEVSNLDPQSGAVSRMKIYASNNGTVGDYELINDIDLTPTEIFIDSTNVITPDIPLGSITSQNVLDTYWGLDKVVNGTTSGGILSYDSSSLMNSSDPKRTSDGNSEFDNFQLFYIDGYPGTFIKNCQYKLSFNAIAHKVASSTFDPKVSIYLSGSAFNPATDLLNANLGTNPTHNNLCKKIGEITTTADTKRYDDQEFIFEPDHTGNGTLIFVLEKGKWQFSEISVTSDAEFGFTENFTRLRTLVPVEHKSDNQLSFKIEYYNIAGNKSKTVSILNNQNFEGGNRYIDGPFSMMTGSLYVADTLETGVEIAGKKNTGYVRSLGYPGFNEATGSGPGGFLLFSGSALPEQSTTTYDGVGLEMVANENNYFRFRTDPAILDIRTETIFLSGSDVEINTPKFFLGQQGSQFLSGSNGNIEISSSNFQLKSDGTINATGGKIGGFSIGANKLETVGVTIADSTQPLFIDSNGFEVTHDGAVTAKQITVVSGSGKGFGKGVETLLDTSTGFSDGKNIARALPITEFGISDFCVFMEGETKMVVMGLSANGQTGKGNVISGVFGITFGVIGQGLMYIPTMNTGSWTYTTTQNFDTRVIRHVVELSDMGVVPGYPGGASFDAQGQPVFITVTGSNMATGFGCQVTAHRNVGAGGAGGKSFAGIGTVDTT